MSNQDEIYKQMAKDFLDAFIKRSAPSALYNTKGIWFHRNESTHVYGVKEGKEKPPGCTKAYTLLNYLGIQAGRFGGTEKHKLNCLLELTDTEPSQMINVLFEKFGRENIATIYTERKLDKQELEIISEFEPNFWYLGTLEFGDKGEAKKIYLK